MTLLFRIIYAAHANGTHHKIALDALPYLTAPDAEKWQRVFLKHADLYLEGSKAPDNEFKDFKNHVLHVRDGFWGGAPEKATSWYGHLVEALTRNDWPQAAYAAGVLSHYYSDPVMPFHTAQSDAENAIHRATEWSINRSYDAVRAAAVARGEMIAPSKPAGADWLKDFVIQGAETSNTYYETLIAHYDIHKGVVEPPLGLDDNLRRVIGDLLIYASRGFAIVLDSAIADSHASAPDIPLTAETLIATLKIPLKFVQKKLADAEDRRIVEAMYDELKATGKVEATLPEDDRQVRDLYEREVAAPRQAALAAEREQRLQQPPAPVPERPQPVAAIPPPAAAHDPGAPKAAPPPRVTPIEKPTARPARATKLKPSDNVEAGPSIGPRMAERLAPLGVVSVSDLLAAEPDALAADLGDRRVTGSTVRDWQDQARLVMAVPGVTGGQSQLLIGAGYRSAEAIADADPTKLCADVLAFAATSDGQRVLRDSAAPSMEAIAAWIDSAKVAHAA